jgi:hypothetical protein
MGLRADFCLLLNQITCREVFSRTLVAYPWWRVYQLFTRGTRCNSAYLIMSMAISPLYEKFSSAHESICLREIRANSTPQRLNDDTREIANCNKLADALSGVSHTLTCII